MSSSIPDSKYLEWLAAMLLLRELEAAEYNSEIYFLESEGWNGGNESDGLSNDSICALRERCGELLCIIHEMNKTLDENGLLDQLEAIRNKDFAMLELKNFWEDEE